MAAAVSRRLRPPLPRFSLIFPPTSPPGGCSRGAYFCLTFPSAWIPPRDVNRTRRVELSFSRRCEKFHPWESPREDPPRNDDQTPLRETNERIPRSISPPLPTSPSPLPLCRLILLLKLCYVRSLPFLSFSSPSPPFCGRKRRTLSVLWRSFCLELLWNVYSEGRYTRGWYSRGGWWFSVLEWSLAAV